MRFNLLKVLGTFMLLIAAAQVHANSIVAAEAFIDDANTAPGTGIAIPLTALGAISEAADVIDISALSLGHHTIYFRSKDENNTWSEPFTMAFTKKAPPDPDGNHISQAEYFIDNNDLGKGLNTALAVQADSGTYAHVLENLEDLVDFGGLAEGFHTVSVRTRDKEGNWNLPFTQTFVVPSQTHPSNHIAAAEYFLGSDPGVGKGTAIIGNFNDLLEILEQGGVHNNNFPGFYKVGFRSKDQAGNWSETIVLRYEIPEGGIPEPTVMNITTLIGNTTENGGQVSFTVVLAAEPTANVSVSISSSDTSEGTVDKSGLTFTPTNWNQPQTVTITGKDDTVLDGDVAYQIHISDASSEDLRYHGYGAKTLFLANIDTDSDPPSVTASVESGAYEFSKTVELTCMDTEFGCDAIYYTLDATTPTTDSTPYTGPISIEADTTLEAIATDKAGNVSDVLIRTYQINAVDETAPVVTISNPTDGGNYDELFSIEGTSSDVGSGVKSVQIQITDGSRYWGPLFDEFNWVDEPHWLDVYPGNYPDLPKDWATWGIGANNIDLYSGTTYTVTARAVDDSGNESYDSVIFTLAGNQAYTTLTADLSSQTLLQNETLDISGKLTRLPETTISLAGRVIKLTVTKPDASVVELQTETYNTYGHYFFDDIDVFNLKGHYSLQLDFEATPLLSASAVSTSVLVGSSAGYAIILQGKHPSEEGLASHNKTTNRIYDTLKKRGFIDENILYLNYDTNQAGVDGLPSRAAIIDALTTWLPSRVNGSPAPMYLIFADHGNPDTFYLDSETFSASDLNGWLNTLEGRLSEFALLEPRTVIYGACYSGSFLPALSKASTLTDAGRIIVTSSASDEVSYKGPNETDNIRSGEYFLESLFTHLGRGQSLAKAFASATKETERYTRKGGSSTNSFNKYFDTAVQHPLLDDNGDGEGTNLLSNGSDDGQLAKELFLGSGLNYDTNSVLNPAEVIEVAPVQILNELTSGATLWLKANDDASVSSAWAEVRSPQTELSPSSSTEQLSNDLPKILMTFNERAGRWEAIYPNFNTAGRYEIYYFVKDNETGNLSPMMPGSVYKQQAGNQAPVAGNLISPGYGEDTRTVLLIDWQDATDTESHELYYTLEIATDDQFSQIVHTQEDLRQSRAVIDNAAGLQDLTRYYWRVRVMDFYGASDVSETFAFDTDNTNGIPGILRGIIFSDQNFSRLSAVAMSAQNQAGGSPVVALTDDNGEYVLLVNDGLVDLTGSLSGFANVSQTAVEVFSGEVTELNLAMGEQDSDGDGVVDSQDAFPNDAIGSNDSIDHDSDGMPDVFEAQYDFLNPLDAGDAVLDEDNDGYTNKEEYDAGTNPNDPNEVPRRSSVILKILPLILNQ